jgi:alpha-L-rhamnosidase
MHLSTARISPLSILLGGILLCLQIAWISPLWSQDAVAADALDPARDSSRLINPASGRPLTEQYIWTHETAHTAPSSNDAVEWVFRRTFTLNAAPRQATLYVAASGDVEVWLNGIRLLTYLDDRTLRAGYTVHAMNVAPSLRAGDNALAIRVCNLHGTHHTTTDREMLQFIGGHAIAVKLLPAERGVEAAPLLISDAAWQGKQQPSSADSDEEALRSAAAAQFDATAWPAVESLGPIEGNINFFQWNADAGMYAWPGYVGASPFLMHYTLQPLRLLHIYAGSATLEHAERLTESPTREGDPFVVELSVNAVAEESPALTIDFGREVAGRIHLKSASDAPILVRTAYGESEEEALHEPFLGSRTVYLPPHGEAWGPKSAFRFVRLWFLTDARFARIDLDGIAYPVEYKGSFTSSDAQLNRIWATAAYTAHLCMQDGLWDGVKRDRARWAGDIDVSGRVINDVFADPVLLEDTLTRLIDETGGTRAVNGITGYSALWVSSVAEFYRHSGDREFLLHIHSQLLDLLKTMDRDIDADGIFSPLPGEHVFVDWSPGFSADTPEARRATDFEYMLAYKQAAWLLTEMDDPEAAEHYKARYDDLRRSARGHLFDKAAGTFGDSWQANAMAVLSGAASEEEYPAIWNRVFANTNVVTAGSPVITPYYGYYMLRAMAMLGHRAEALRWMRGFWGGMLAEGATSFWESYDPRWTKHNFHTGLQADGLAGYYVSLAHGWSSGPAAWLMEELLGVQPTGAGFRTVVIDPETTGLAWIDGSVPTPSGVIHVHAQGNRIALDLPAGVAATVLVKASARTRIELNGTPARTRITGEPEYRSLEIGEAGRYEIVSK